MNIHHLGMQDYEEIWRKMKEFTCQRDENSTDELWLLEHFSVYTQGQAGKPEHILNPNGIKIVQSDRGGQVTYHGPGQLVGYVLMDIRRRNLGIRTMVCQLEKVLISTLGEYSIDAHTQCGAPGVYVSDQKIASIGLRVKNGCTYHGIALNINMDLSPFLGINPCGYATMKMTQMSHFVPEIRLEEVSQFFEQNFLNQFDQ
ncbi:lipoyl(octanoyl) transferase LipB [Legionella worsleiensis]|uniref:Octanoyltransferase n=1 Tax=Legionella worsleiensis TaxID=45076 RepID=A0A0W1AJG2_9GAMM|nr:lipoyl(octanoyl) transferase LipB [Legionella worsleiensis]KTD81360.1 lipoyltransferase [Legionella worsleiensis]STY29958.1 lipoyl(octanoyl) transferase [Legionella worsleiensis]